MKSFFLASIFGLFLTFIVIGVLSISPVFDSPETSEKLSSIFAKILPEPELESEPEKTDEKVAIADVPAQKKTAVTPTSSPKVLGLETQASSVTTATLYGLINGARRDQNRSILHVNTALEKAALMLNATAIDPTASALDELSTIQAQNYKPVSFTVLTAESISSNWAVIAQWQEDARSALLLGSDTFSEMGMSVNCSGGTGDSCRVLMILATQ